MVSIYKITSPSGKVYIGQSWDILIVKVEVVFSIEEDEEYFEDEEENY